MLLEKYTPIIPPRWNIFHQGVVFLNGASNQRQRGGDEEPDIYWVGWRVRWPFSSSKMKRGCWTRNDSECLNWQARARRRQSVSTLPGPSIGISRDLLWNCHGLNVACRWMSFANKRSISAPQSSFSVWASVYEISVQSPSTTRSGGGGWLISLRLIWCFRWVEGLGGKRREREEKGVNIEFSKVSCVVKHFRCGCVLRSLSPGGGHVVRLCPTGKVLLIKHRHYDFLW